MGLNLRIKEQKSEPNLIILPPLWSGIFIPKIRKEDTDMNNIEKAIEIRNARIRFVSLVDKAANLQSFLVTKNKDGEASFK